MIKLPDGELTIGDEKALISFIKDKKLDTVIDLGTFMGRSAAIFSQHVNKVITIDIFEDIDLLDNIKNKKWYYGFYTRNPHPYETIKDNLAMFKNVECIKAKTYEYANSILDNSIDLIFIDADHTYEGCKQDFDSWFSKVKQSKYIMFHDSHKDSIWKDIVKFMNELKMRKDIKLINDTLEDSSISIWQKI